MTTSTRPTKYEGRLDFEVNQASHGFSVGTPVYHNGTSYAASSAASTTTGEVIAVVSEVKDTDNFTALPAGRIRNLSGLTAGSVYFLSETAGQVTTTSPTISKPVYFAVSTTEAIILPYRGGTGSGGLSLDNLSDVNAPSPSDNDILTYDSVSGEWINEAPSGGGGDMELITTVTPSAASTVEFTGLSSTYHSYKLVFNMTGSSDNQNIRLRMSTNNGSTFDSGASDYSASIFNNISSNTYNTRSEILVNGAGLGAAANEGASGQIFIINPSATEYTRAYGQVQYTAHTPNNVTNNFGGVRNTTTAVDAIQLSMTGGTITGIFKLYGVKA